MANKLFDAISKGFEKVEQVARSVPTSSSSTSSASTGRSISNQKQAEAQSLESNPSTVSRMLSRETVSEKKNLLTQAIKDFKTSAARENPNPVDSSTYSAYAREMMNSGSSAQEAAKKAFDLTNPNRKETETSTKKEETPQTMYMPTAQEKSYAAADLGKDVKDLTYGETMQWLIDNDMQPGVKSETKENYATAQERLELAKSKRGTGHTAGENQRFERDIEIAQAQLDEAESAMYPNGKPENKLFEWGKNVLGAFGTSFAGQYSGAQRTLYEAGQKQRTQQNIDKVNQLAYDLMMQAYAQQNDKTNPEESYEGVANNTVEQLKAYCSVLGDGVYEQIVKLADQYADELVAQGENADFNSFYDFMSHIDYDPETGLQQQATKIASDYANAMLADSQKYTDFAKSVWGGNSVGGFITDASINALQMLGDATVNLIAPGMSLPAMFVRTFGASAQEAEANGANLYQQLGYATVSGGIEVGTEMMFDGLAGIYGKGEADDIVEGVIRKIAGANETEANALRLVFSGLGEAAEEGVAGGAEPLAEAIYKGIESIPEGYSKEQIEDTLYSMLIGFALGGAGGGVEIANGNYAEANFANAQINQLQQTYEAMGISPKKAAQLATLTDKISNGDVLTRAELDRLASATSSAPELGLDLTRQAAKNERAHLDAVGEYHQQSSENAWRESAITGVGTMPGTNAVMREDLGMTDEEIADLLETAETKPAEEKAKPEEAPAETPTETPTETPVEESAETAEESAEEPASEEVSTETDTETPLEEKVENIAETPAESPQITKARETVNRLTEEIERLRSRGKHSEAKIKENQLTSAQNKLTALIEQASQRDVSEPVNPLIEATAGESPVEVIDEEDIPAPGSDVKRRYLDAQKAYDEAVERGNPEEIAQARAEILAAQDAISDHFEQQHAEEAGIPTEETAENVDSNIDSETASEASETSTPTEIPSETQNVSEVANERFNSKSEEESQENASQTTETGETETVKKGTVDNLKSQLRDAIAEVTALRTQKASGAEVQAARKRAKDILDELRAAQTDTTQLEDKTAEFNDLAKRGSIPPGERSVRDDTTPELDAAGNVVGRGARTIIGAEATPEERLKDLKSAVVDGQFSHVPVSNDSRSAEARAKIVKNGWEKTATEVISTIRGGNTSADTIALAANLLNLAGNTPEVTGAMYIKLAVAYNSAVSEAGSALAAARILSSLTPEGKIYAMQATVEAMNEANKARQTKTRRGKKKQKTVEAEAETIQKITTDATSDAAKAIDTALEEVAVDPKNEDIVFTFEYANEAAETIAKSINKALGIDPNSIHQPTMMEHLTNTIKKFATEHVKKPTVPGVKMTSTDILTEFAQNEAFAREVYERAQEIVRGEYAESDFANEAIDLATSKIVERAIAESAVATSETRSTIAKQSALGVSEAQIGTAIANDLITKAGITGELADTVRGVSQNYVRNIMAGIDETKAPTVTGIVQRAMREIGKTFLDLTVASKYTREAARQQVTDILTKQYAVDEASASTIADSVLYEFDNQLQKSINEKLESQYGKKPAKERPPRTMAQELAEAIALGTFNSEYAQQAASSIFGYDGIHIPEELIEEYLKQTSDEGREEVHKRIIKSVADQIPSTLQDKLTNLRYTFMLGNIKTQVKNIVGNTSMTVTQKVKNSLVTAIEAATEELSGGKYKRTYDTFYSKALFLAAKNDIMQNPDILKAAKGEQKYTDVRHQFSSEIEEQRKKNVWTHGENAVTEALGIEAGSTNPLYQAVGAVSNLTNAVMEGGDVIFIVPNYADALAGYLHAHGISAEEWSKMVANPERASEVDAARSFAIEQAQEATFRDKNMASDFVATFDSNWGKTPMGRVMKALLQGIMPFRRTPANVLVRMEEYSPLGFINTTVKALMARNGNATLHDVIDSFSKAFTGSALVALGFFLASKDMARTRDDDDKQEAFDKLQGKQDYSIEINGHSFTADALSPNSAALFMGVEAYRLWQNGDITFANLGTVLSRLSDPLLEMSMLSGVNDALSVVSDFDGDNSALTQVFLQAAWSYVSQGLTSTLGGQIEQFSEDYRQTYYTDPDNPYLSTANQKRLAKALNKIGINGIFDPDFQSADYIDAWGRKQKNEENLLARAIQTFASPTYYSDTNEKSTEVDDELQRLYDYGQTQDEFPNVLPQTPYRSTTVNGTRLSPEEYETYAIAKGQKSLELVKELMASDAYSMMTDEDKAEVISDIYSYAGYEASKMIADQRGEEYTNSTYSKLMDGVRAPGDSNDYTALDADNFVAYRAYSRAYDTAVENGDYSTADSIVKAIGKVDQNLKTVFTERVSSFRKVTGYSQDGLSSQAYYAYGEGKKKAQEVLDAETTSSGNVMMLGLLYADITDEERAKIIGDFDKNNGGITSIYKNVYGVLKDYDVSFAELYEFVEEAETKVDKRTGEAKDRTGTLDALEAAYALSLMPNMTEDEKSEAFDKLRAIYNDGYYNNWKNYTYESEVNWINSGRSYYEHGSKHSITGEIPQPSSDNPLYASATSSTPSTSPSGSRSRLNHNRLAQSLGLG